VGTPGALSSSNVSIFRVFWFLLSRESVLTRVRVLLADDHDDLLRVVARLLEPEFEVVKTVGTGQAAVDESAMLKPDLLILDISMPVLNGIEAAKRLRACGSLAKIVFLSVHADQDYLRAAMAAGALGYVVKSRMALDLLPALKEAVAGRSYVSPSLAEGNAC
jgi:DNA-binding NarL/FixJ family response regulator